MLRILVISQDPDASNEWFKEIERLRAEPGVADQPWEIVVQGIQPEQVSFDCDLIFVDAYCSRNPNDPRSQMLLDICLQLRSITNKVILLHSPVRGEDFAVKAYSVGVDEYIYKPISPWLLWAKLKAWQQWTSKSFLMF